jgi:hypothetical protein
MSLGSFLYLVKGNLIGADVSIGSVSTLSDEGEATVVTPASSKTKSLRTTIPAGLVRQFGIDEQDRLSWKMEIINGKLAIVVRPLKAEKPAKK